MSDYKGAALILSALPAAKKLLATEVTMPTGSLKALDERGITACIPGRSNRKIPIGYDRELYRQHKIENMFGRLKLAAHLHSL